MTSALQAIKAKREQEETARKLASEGAILTGMASTADPSPANTPVQPTEPKQPEVPDADDSSIEDILAQEFPDGYKMNQVKRLVLSDGTIVKPNAYGVIVPSLEEEKALLEHFAKQGPHKVQRLKAAE